MDYLISISLRSILLACVAGLALWLCRVKSAPIRHAAWTLVTSGMLLQAMLIPWLPKVRLPLLRPTHVVPVNPGVSLVDSPSMVAPGAVSHRTGAGELIVFVYLGGVLWCAAQLAYAGWFTFRLVRESAPVGGRRYESRRISVPVTVGRKILLPAGWREWDAGKLALVLAHEEAHVARWDWAVAAMARINRCVFWFHPQAWWLEKVLSRLAEQICDDAALAAAPDRGTYAAVLVDMARAAGARGRLVFGTVAMAKETNMEIRINRVLNASRRIPKSLGSAGWLGLTVCTAMLVYFTAVAQLAPAQSKAEITDYSRPAVAPTQAAEHPAPPRLVAQARPPVPVVQATPGDNATATISGTVMDPWGAVVARAMVRVSGPKGDLLTSTNPVGEWMVEGLAPGSYSLAISVPGFVENRVNETVAAGSESHIKTLLMVGSTQETVTIRAPGNSAPAQARTGGPIRVGGNVQAATRTKNVDPVYPQSARDRGASGLVIIQALISKSGLVTQSRVVNAAPADLSDAALEAVQNWEYTPALLDGEPVETLTTITINFQLDQR